MRIDLVSHRSNEFLDEAIDCQTVSVPMTQLMQDYCPKTRMSTSSVQKNCDVPPYERGQQTTVKQDFKDLFERGIESPSTSMKDSLSSFGDNQTSDQDAFTDLELLSYQLLEELGLICVVLYGELPTNN